MRQLLVLRPEPGASATLERAKALALDARSVPLFKVVPVAWEPPDPASFDALLVTSANAVRHAGARLRSLRGLPAYAVGNATAEAARDAGFDIRGTGDEGVERLLGSIEPDLRLLHLTGENHRAPDDARQQVTALPVYRADEIPSPDLGDTAGAVALIHSPRAGRRFAELVSNNQEVTLAAISHAAAEAAGAGWACVEAAKSPTDEALLALAERLCNKP